MQNTFFYIFLIDLFFQLILPLTDYEDFLPIFTKNNIVNHNLNNLYIFMSNLELTVVVPEMFSI